MATWTTRTVRSMKMREGWKSRQAGDLGQQFLFAFRSHLLRI